MKRICGLENNELQRSRKDAWSQVLKLHNWGPWLKTNFLSAPPHPILCIVERNHVPSTPVTIRFILYLLPPEKLVTYGIIGFWIVLERKKKVDFFSGPYAKITSKVCFKNNEIHVFIFIVFNVCKVFNHSVDYYILFACICFKTEFLCIAVAVLELAL